MFLSPDKNAVEKLILTTFDQARVNLFCKLISVCAFLQQKYFDSGDYNMAKAKMKNKQLPTATAEKTEITGDHIPTPQDLPQRKTSLVASKLAV